MSETRQYELVYVVSPETDEDGVAGLHTQIAEIVDRLGGRIDKTDNWGRRQLAYEIERHREGTYVLELISGPGDIVSEIDRRLRVSDNVLRHLVVRVDEDLRKAQRARERRQSRAQRRRAAKGQPPAGPPRDEAAAAAPTAGVEEGAATGAAAAQPAAEATAAAETGAAADAAAPQAGTGGETSADEASAEPGAAAKPEAAESEVES